MDPELNLEELQARLNNLILNPRVSKIIKNQEHGAILWHMATSFQNGIFANEFRNFSKIIDSHFKDSYYSRKTTSASIRDIIINIANVLHGSNGVYYSITARDMTKLEVPVFHIACTVYAEKISGKKIKGADHVQKAISILNSIINNIQVLTEILVKEQDKRDTNKEYLKRLYPNNLTEGNKSLIGKFIIYLKLHAKLIRTSLLYKAKEVSNYKEIDLNQNCLEVTYLEDFQADFSQGLNSMAMRWHGPTVSDATPNKDTFRTPLKKQVADTTRAMQFTPDTNNETSAAVITTNKASNSVSRFLTFANQSPERNTETSSTAKNESLAKRLKFSP